LTVVECQPPEIRIMGVATHILLTTDFSEASEGAVAKAGELARSSSAKLTVLHVHSRPPAAPEAFVPSEKVVVSADLDAEAHQALEKLKGSKLAGVESIDLATVEHVSAPLAICDYADHHGVDLIVIGTHGRTSVNRLLIGSVAEKVVRHATCPVLVVPHGKHRPPM
jgi:nucleotide-binding universal stress UspA family protein